MSSMYFEHSKIANISTEQNHLICKNFFLPTALCTNVCIYVHVRVCTYVCLALPIVVVNWYVYCVSIYTPQDCAKERGICAPYSLG